MQMDDPLNSPLETESSISEAFRGPAADAVPKRIDGLRLKVRPDEPVRARLIRPTGFKRIWGFLFPNAVEVELSGKFSVTLKIYPSHVQIDKRRWLSKTSVFARFKVAIPVYAEIGDEPAHELVVRGVLAFFYPFVPIHAQVQVDDEIVFAQGKFKI